MTRRQNQMTHVEGYRGRSFSPENIALIWFNFNAGHASFTECGSWARRCRALEGVSQVGGYLANRGPVVYGLLEDRPSS